MLLHLSTGRDVDVPEFRVPGNERPSAFIISIRKSGSTMVTKITEMVAEAAGCGFLDVGSLLFYNNIPAGMLHTEAAFLELLRPGVLFSGFRDYPSIFESSASYASAQKVFFLRDPRDALVSEYFSNAYSHHIPEEQGANADLMQKLRTQALGDDIDSYVLKRASAFSNTAKYYDKALASAENLIMHYEDFIWEKPRLVRALSQHLGIDLPDEKINAIAAAVDIRPKQENPREFVRRVTPGDYKEKLKASTIAELTRLLSKCLASFGYQ